MVRREICLFMILTFWFGSVWMFVTAGFPPGAPSAARSEMERWSQLRQ
jgi:hypothetical protein